MNVIKIKTKPILEKTNLGAIRIGRKIIIEVEETQDLSINEVAKIEEFIKGLRT